ncbi:hypothetical protein FQZ97_1005610 [compost metagenome]
MGGAVGVHYRVRVEEAELAAQLVEVVRVAGEEQPARSHMVGFGVFAEDFRRIQLRLQGDGVHEDLTPGTLAQQLLGAAQVGGHGGAEPAAQGVHHVEGHHLVAHQVVIELHPFAQVGVEGDVGEVAGAEAVALGVFGFGGGPVATDQAGAQRGQPGGGHAGAQQQVSASVHLVSPARIEDWSWLSSPGTRLAARAGCRPRCPSASSCRGPRGSRCGSA